MFAFQLTILSKMQNIVFKQINLVDKAIEALKSSFPIQVTWENSPNTLPTIDGFFVLPNKRLATEVKIGFRISQLNEILKQKSNYGELLLITDGLSDVVKTILKKEAISYLDTTGNAFFFYPPTLTILIEGKKKLLEREKQKDKAFTKSGMRLVFEYLKDATLLQKTYRKIADLTNVSLDTIAKTNESLKQQGFISQVNEKQIVLTNPAKLLLKWADIYDTRIKPSLFYGKYRFLNAEAELNWKNLALQTPTCWGGEAAAALLTQDLRPEIFTIYTTETRAHLMRNYRLKPDITGNVHVYLPFADNHYLLNDDYKLITHSVLTYIDLLNSGDARNFDIAQKIYEKYISVLF
jgi:hypothetical protein